jgi:hypothetical protein
MHASRRSAWDFFAAVTFIFGACLVCWGLSFAAAFGPNFTITIRPLQWAVDTKFILLTAATFLAALYCFLPQESQCKLESLFAGHRHRNQSSSPELSGVALLRFPLGREAAMHFGRVFAWNLFMAPFWEEIVWR